MSDRGLPARFGSDTRVDGERSRFATIEQLDRNFSVASVLRSFRIISDSSD